MEKEGESTVKEPMTTARGNAPASPPDRPDKPPARDSRPNEKIQYEKKTSDPTGEGAPRNNGVQGASSTPAPEKPEGESSTSQVQENSPRETLGQLLKQLIVFLNNLASGTADAVSVEGQDMALHPDGTPVEQDLVLDGIRELLARLEIELASDSGMDLQTKLAELLQKLLEGVDDKNPLFQKALDALLGETGITAEEAAGFLAELLNEGDTLKDLISAKLATFDPEAPIVRQVVELFRPEIPLRNVVDPATLLPGEGRVESVLSERTTGASENTQQALPTALPEIRPLVDPLMSTVTDEALTAAKTTKLPPGTAPLSGVPENMAQAVLQNSPQQAAPQGEAPLTQAVQSAQSAAPGSGGDLPRPDSGQPQSSGTERVQDNSQANAAEKPNTRFISYLSRAFGAENQIIERIVNQVRLNINAETRDIRFNLYPPDLGQIRVIITENDGLVTARLRVDTFVIKDIVESNIGVLRQSLSESVRLDKLEVEVREDAPDRKDFNFLNQMQGGNDGDAGHRRAEDLYARYGLDPEAFPEGYNLDIPIPEGIRLNALGQVSVDLIG